MKNSINSPITGLDATIVDQYLPFEGKEVWVWSITKLFRNYGHWTLSVDIEVAGRRNTLTTVTTSSLMIDYWEGLDGEKHNMIDDDYVGKLAAINEVLNDNEKRLLEMVEKPETENED